jgi:hypothetical protein
MNKAGVVRACLEVTFGSEPKLALKSFVNEALDSGEYYEGFEIAIQKGELDYKDYDELLASFQAAYRDVIPDMAELEELFDKELPQAYFSKLSWLVSSENEIYATDGLRVIKTVGSKLKWATGRVSWDGINLLELNETEIIGQWYTPIDDDNPWQPLKLSRLDGSLIQGEIIG